MSKITCISPVFNHQSEYFDLVDLIKSKNYTDKFNFIFSHNFDTNHKDYVEIPSTDGITNLYCDKLNCGTLYARMYPTKLGIPLDNYVFMYDIDDVVYWDKLAEINPDELNSDIIKFNYDSPWKFKINDIVLPGVEAKYRTTLNSHLWMSLYNSELYTTVYKKILDSKFSDMYVRRWEDNIFIALINQLAKEVEFRSTSIGKYNLPNGTTVSNISSIMSAYRSLDELFELVLQEFPDCDKEYLMYYKLYLYKCFSVQSYEILNSLGESTTKRILA